MNGERLLGYLTTLFQTQMLYSIERQNDHEFSIINETDGSCSGLIYGTSWRA
jgi:hypothetical protein